MVKLRPVALTSPANCGQSFALLSVTSTLVTMFVFTPHIRCTLTQSCFSMRLLSLYLALTHWTKRQVEKPDESTAKSDSTACNGKLDSSISCLRKGVSIGFSR